MKKVIFISFISLIFLFATAQNSFACSCMVSDKPLKTQVIEAYTDSTAIFSGEVLKITQQSEFEMIVKIKVAKFWKGKASRIITIKTASQSSLCGYSFEVGKKYLVYANGTKNDLSTNNCSRTTWESNKTDIEFLDNLKRTKGKSA